MAGRLGAQAGEEISEEFISKFRGMAKDLLNTAKISMELSDEEMVSAARVVHTNLRVAREHVTRRFGGDLLIIAAADGGPQDVAPSTRWQDHVLGDITEVRLPCAHNDLIQPDMLARAWNAISAFLSAEGGRRGLR